MAWAVALLAICGGVGWLYLLRQWGALPIGGRVAGALPLEELALGGAQPLLRMVAAWLPAGIAAGIALGAATRLRAGSVAAACGALGLFVIGATTIGSEAVIHNAPVASHVWPALARPGVWVAVALIATGSLLGAIVARGRRGAGSSAAGGHGSAAL